jgi:hypothetical protein
MEKNVGKTDKVVRLTAALILAVLVVSGVITGALGVVFIIIAAILLFTGLSGSCPLYTLMKINTNENKKGPDAQE